MKHRICTAAACICLLLMMALPAFAAEYGEPDITPQTTMGEIRSNPSILGAGVWTYSKEQNLPALRRCTDLLNRLRLLRLLLIRRSILFLLCRFPGCFRIDTWSPVPPVRLLFIKRKLCQKGKCSFKHCALFFTSALPDQINSGRAIFK